MKVLVEVSARHVHLSQDVLSVLFGKNYKLNIKKELSQPGQFACSEKVIISGPKGMIENVSILGPVREKTQVEVSLTDSRKLGIWAKIRESGDLENTDGCKLIGPKGEVDLTEGLIIAKRHIHMTPKEAKDFDVENGETVWVSVGCGERALIFGETVVRVSDKYSLAMHIDTDEANAAGITNACYGEIIKNKG